ncbi:hypothetical protein ACHAWF_003220 [Thalassiosira exigua]
MAGVGGVAPHDNPRSTLTSSRRPPLFSKDVLFGRGSDVACHPGNRRLRSIAQPRKPQFLAAGKMEKRVVAKEIVEEIGSSVPPGRFLIRDPIVWVPVGAHKAVEKVMHLLRERERPQENLLARPEHCPSISNDRGGDNKDSTTKMPGVRLSVSNDMDGQDVQRGRFPQHAINQNVETKGQKVQNGSLELDQISRANNQQQEPLSIGPTQMGQPEEAWEAGEFDALVDFVFGDAPPPLDRKEAAKTGDYPQKINLARGQAREEGDDDSFDALVESLFDDPAPPLDDRHEGRPAEPCPKLRRLTLREWIDDSDRKCSDDGGNSSHVESAIPLALALVDFLLATDDGEDAVPLACIAGDNVTLFVDSRRTSGSVEVVIRGEIARLAGERQGRGGDMQRLFALGVILYEVFSRRPLPGAGPSNPLSSSTSATVGGLSLTDETMETHEDRQSKRSQRTSSRAKDSDIHWDSIAHLEMLGIPRSVLALIGNLLDCSDGDFCGDDAYRSLADVRTDLKLMRDDPTCFLHDLRLSTNASFEIRPKLYGREGDLSKIEDAYQQHIAANCGGIKRRRGGQY